MANKALRVGVLETGRPPQEFNGRFDDYPSMVRQWLGGLVAEFSVYPVFDQEFPANPDDADLWVITGSKCGAYEDHPWIPPLEAFIRDVRDARKLMLGICFGHQIIAQALGGVVRKSTKGWGLGIHEYAITDNWPEELGQAPEKIAIQAYHQDQIEEAPQGAVTIAATEFCEHGALWYPGFALTVQGHPEFDKSYASELIERHRGTVLTNQDADQGQRNMAIADNRFALAALVEKYLMRQHQGTI